MLLELDHISKIYGDLRAVDDLNLTVPEGEWLAIVGSSGSGKTTLMNMIGCMDTPSKGSVKLEGRKLEDLNATQLADVRKNLIGLVFQKFYLVPHLTAVENVMVAQYYHSVVDEKQAMEALEKVDGCTGAHFHPPVMLLVAYDPEAAWKREDDGKNHGEIDAAIAVTQMMLQAADLGLGTTYVGMFDPEKLHAAFPELAGLTPIALLPMGYPAEGAHPSRLHTDRKPLEELVRYL